jgi:hypothetical protein
MISSIMNSGFSFSDRDSMMRFTGLGVGHLKFKAHMVHRLTVEDEPNWSELCSTTPESERDPATTAVESDLVDTDSDLEDTDFDDQLEEDPGDTIF